MENSQETNLDTDNLETEPSISGFFQIFAPEKERKSDKNNKKSS
jgi:hypothetical protein